LTKCRLYLITPNGLEAPGALVAFTEHLRAALGAGDVACLQLRIKGADDDLIRRAAETLMPIAHEAGVAFLINDRPDLAAELGADGAHIGQDDMAYGKARAILGPERMIGVTAHASRHLGLEAAEAGADYVAFGAFFPTRTKEPKARADLELLTWWREIIEVPCVAIGGITPENARALIEAGADFIAVSSGVWDHQQGPAAAVKAFNALITSSA
jgi:thiamine-phosphate pyrophosphorylase